MAERDQARLITEAEAVGVVDGSETDGVAVEGGVRGCIAGDVGDTVDSPAAEEMTAVGQARHHAELVTGIGVAAFVLVAVGLIQIRGKAELVGLQVVGRDLLAVERVGDGEGRPVGQRVDCAVLNVGPVVVGAISKCTGRCLFTARS